MQLLDDTKFIAQAGAAVAAQTDLDGAVIDTAQDRGYSALLLIAYLGDVSAGSVLELTLRGSPNSDGSASVLEATTGTFTADATSADGKVILLDVARTGGNRYVFARLKRGTANAVVNGLLAVLYRGTVGPVVQGADVIKSIQKVQ